MPSYPSRRKAQPQPHHGHDEKGPPLSDLSRWFDYHDRNKSGSLDREEVVAALSRTAPFDQLGPRAVREMVYCNWLSYDHDMNGTVDKREFCEPGALGDSLAAITGQYRQSPPRRYRRPADHHHATAVQVQKPVTTKTVAQQAPAPKTQSQQSHHKQQPVASTVHVQETDTETTARPPVDGHNSAASTPASSKPAAAYEPEQERPIQTPWQSWESFRRHACKEVPLATKRVPPNEIFPNHSNVRPSGRRKALLIGINYKETPAALQGCVNDSKKMKDLLVQHGFKDDSYHMVMLVDDDDDAAPDNDSNDYLPTGQNIIKGLQWLVQGASEGDVLFFHYSGHGAQLPDKTEMEADGLNETIIPLNYEDGQITDDIIWSTIVYPLPSGVKLTVIMDCCHSGTVLDLPFRYKKQQGLDMDDWVEEVNPAHSKGHVVLFSGCMDSQKSADFKGKYRAAGGAMTQSFLSAYQQNPTPTYLDLMASIRHHLKERDFSQTPQLTSSQKFNVDDNVFSFVEGIQPNRNKVIGRMKRKRIKPGSADHRKSVVESILFGVKAKSIVI